MSTSHLYFSPRMEISHTFCSTRMVGLANTALGLEKVFWVLRQLHDEFHVKAAARLSDRAHEELMSVLAEIVSEERWGIHFEEERLVTIASAPHREAHYELRLYSAFIRLPVSWLAKNRWDLAWKLARGNPKFGDKIGGLITA